MDNVENSILDNCDIGKRFSFTDTAGSMIVNSEFEQGFVNYSAGKNDKTTYIWKTLSAISEDMGQTIYNNIEKYIDLVSNVELCKISNIQSMMQMLGMNYEIFDEYSMVPNEMMGLLNLFSINRKYFTRDGYVKDEILSAMVENGVISGDVSRKDFSSSPLKMKDTRTFSTENYHGFLFDTYTEFLMDVLTMQYCETDIYMFPDVEEEIRNQYYSEDSKTATEQDSYADKMRTYGINPSFDYDGILKDINDGHDSLDNYQGYELSLLLEITEDRKNPISKAPNARYCYYQKEKVKEYRNFITNKYYTITLSADENGSIDYENDVNYYRVKSNNSVLFTNTENTQGKSREWVYDNCINKEMLSTVVNSLVYTTEYVQQLREKIKLQTRKNYMKGTNNLLVYLINEYLIEYFKNNQVSSIQIETRDNGSFIDDIDIIEYDDKTEYSNLKTDLDDYSSLKGTTCNERFWQDGFGDGLNFTLQEIQNFYLSVMNMKYGVSSCYENSFLTDFLDTVYGCGASTQSYNKKGFVNTQIERNGQYTNELYDRLTSLSSNYLEFLKYVDNSRYTYPEDTLSVQIQDVLNNHIYGRLSAKYLSSISDVYDEFEPQVVNIEKTRKNLENQYNDMLSGSNSFYYEKPSEDRYPYSYQNGDYKHPNDYYVSSNYDTGLVYVYDKLLRLQQFIQSPTTIKNYPILDAVEEISSQLNNISSRFQEQIVDNISLYGYVDISSENLDENMDNANTFLNQKTTARYTSIQSNIDNIRQQANQLLTMYNTLYQNVTNLLANYSGGDVSSLWISFGVCKCRTGEFAEGEGYVRKGETIVDHDTWTKNHNDQFYYDHAYSSEKGKYHVFPELQEKNLLDSSQEGLKSAIDSFLEYLTQTTGVICNVVGEGEEKHCEFEELHSKMNAGTYSSIEQLLNQYKDLETQYSVIAGNYAQMVGEQSYEQPTELKDDIIELIGKVSEPDFPEKVYANDTMIATYSKYIALIIQFRQQFNVMEERYKDIYMDSKQSSYLAEADNIEELKFRCLQNILKYTIQKDGYNKGQQNLTVQKLLDKYQEAVKTLTDMVDEMSKRRTIPSLYKCTTNILEIEIQLILNFLENDVKNKHSEGMNYVEIDMTSIKRYLDRILKEISDKLSTYENFNLVVIEKINELNFFENDVYRQHEKLFLSYYGGEFSYYPYYNFENVEHPSYQIHPYMWNFVEHNTVLENIGTAIYNTFVQDFESDIIQYKIRDYIGEFGQTVNEWKNNVYDYTGYTSKYENSEHYDKYYSEVVDFDGAFFPRAISYLRENTETAMRCMEFALSGNFIPTSQIFSYQISLSSSGKTGFQISSEIVDFAGPYTMICEDAMSSICGLTEDGQMSSRISEEVSQKEVQECLQGIIEQTFFERFYIHLDMSNGDLSNEIDQICSYYDVICDITDDHDESSVYDIYNYQKDMFDNAYILYKQYGTENPDYKFKKDCAGEIWMRRKNHPFAYPAFYGKYPNIEMSGTRYCMPMLYRLAQTYDSENLSSIENDRMRYFFDIDFSNSGGILYMFSKQTDKGYAFDGETKEEFNKDCNIKQFDKFENCAILIGYLDQEKVEKIEDRTKTTIYDQQQNSSNQVEYILQATSGIRKRPEIMEQSDISSYAYVGCFKTGFQDTCFTYVNKVFHTDGTSNILENNQVRIFEHYNGNIIENYSRHSGCSIISKEENKEDILFKKAYDGQICMSYENGIITFAYLTEQEYSKSGKFDGHTADDISSEDMNSMDSLEQSVKVVQTKIKLKHLVKLESEESDSFLNLNADMSYIPIESSKELLSSSSLVTNPLNSGIAKTDYLNIQLMGRSKDIGDIIKNTNTDMNPYYDYNQLRDNYEFGRVYEDYTNVDTNITSITNENTLYSLYPDDNFITWNASKAFDIKNNSMDDYHVIILNYDTAGKFPYFVGKLSELTGQKILDYDGTYMNESIVKKLENGRTLTITGMNPYSRSSYKSNHIDGICEIKAEAYSDGGKVTLNVTFSKDGSKPKKYTHVRKGTIKVVVFNTNDMHYLNNFHMLDTYGIMNAYDLDMQNAQRYVLDTNCWTIITNRPTEDMEHEKEKLKSYYIDKYGFKKFLKNVEINDYSDIKNMWIFSSDRNLQFKIDDGLFFEPEDKRHYFPSINKKYPITVASYYGDQKMVYSNNGILIDGVYDNDNVYVLSSIDSIDTAQNIGKVTMYEYERPGEDYVVYEDYISSQVIDGISVFNYQLYDESDTGNIEFISSYVHSFETNTSGSIYEIDDMAMFQNINAIKKSEEYKSEFSVGQFNVSITSSDVELDRFVKIFASYDKTEDGRIQLFFNYFNYIDTCFTEIREDGLEYYYYPEGSYLKLDDGEDGILNIYVQLKAFDAFKNLISTRTVKLASYHIYNLSDDKPKFLMDKVYSIKDGDNYEDGENFISLVASNTSIDLSKHKDDEKEKPIDVNFHVFAEQSVENAQYSYKLYIPYGMFTAKEQHTDAYDVVEKDGIIFISVYKRVPLLTIGLVSKYNLGELYKYQGRHYSVLIDEVKTNARAYVKNGSITIQQIVEETALGDFSLSSEEEQSFVGIIKDDVLSANNEIYRVT